MARWEARSASVAGAVIAPSMVVALAEVEGVMPEGVGRLSGGVQVEEAKPWLAK